MGYNGMTDLLLSNFFFLSYLLVYVLWRYPALLPAFKTWPPVLQKLTGGAGMLFFFWGGGSVNRVQSYERILCFSKDLMLPGVVVPSCGLPDVKQGDSCAVTLVNNRYVILNTFGRPFLKNVSVTVSFGLFLEHLLQLGQLLCPLNRCTVWVWKEEESAFFTRTWIISGESLSP